MGISRAMLKNPSLTFLHRFLEFFFSESCQVTSNCSPNGACKEDVTAPDGFSCQCNAGYIGDGFNCLPDDAAGDVAPTCIFDVCTCPFGFVYDGNACLTDTQPKGKDDIRELIVVFVNHSVSSPYRPDHLFGSL